MQGDASELKQYAEDVLERFANPYIKHFLLSITLNSVSKFKTRDLPSLIDYIKKNGSVPAALTFSLAALIAFYEANEIINGEMAGTRNGSPYAIKDDLPILKRFATLYSGDDEPAAKAARLAREVLSDSSWWGEDLTQYQGLEKAVRHGLETIWTKGMKEALEQVCNNHEG